MKYGRLLLLVAVVGAGALWFFQNRSHKPQATYPSHSPAPSATTLDPALVFQKAFWKRPTAADKILHAERREWLDKNGVSRWQWFLEVKPSPDIVRYLRDENAFRLTSRPTATLPADVPLWFIQKMENTRIFTEPGGGMSLIFTAGDAKLFALGEGGGFRPGASEASATRVPAPTQTSVVAGRLPPQSPPIPPADL